MLLPGLFLVILSALVSLAVSFFVMRYAEYLRVMANPNARSSHTRPTPSGGGVGTPGTSRVSVPVRPRNTRTNSERFAHEVTTRSAGMAATMRV